jgi:hypothetical protein
MRIRGREAWAAGLVLAGAWGALPAVDVACGGLSFELPPAWTPGAKGAARLEAPGVTLLAWERQAGGRVLTLVLETAEVRSRAAASRVSRELPRIARAAALAKPGAELELQDLRYLDAGGVPAYRIRGRTTVDDVPVEQLQQVVPGREKTFLLTFVWTGNLPRDIEEEIQEVLGSIRLDPEPVLMDGVPAGALCALLGLLAGLGSLRKRRSG